ncbi:hypothetical protein N037_16950 [Enterobacter sp. EGD-HP1]|nr:hypothetical protein N037_16950 [Enterobacter sp. EGD-HP1]
MHAKMQELHRKNAVENIRVRQYVQVAWMLAMHLTQKTMAVTLNGQVFEF